jgi:hypothetical protein
VITFPNGWVLSEGEMGLAEGVFRLLDRGFCSECAVKLILGTDIEDQWRSPAPCTEGLLVGRFLEWLLEQGPSSCEQPSTNT